MRANKVSGMGQSHGQMLITRTVFASSVQKVDPLFLERLALWRIPAQAMRMCRQLSSYLSRMCSFRKRQRTHNAYPLRCAWQRCYRFI